MPEPASHSASHLPHQKVLKWILRQFSRYHSFILPLPLSPSTKCMQVYTHLPTYPTPSLGHTNRNT